MGASGQSSRGSQSYTRPRGPVAQLVEQGTFNPKVTGSIPVRPIEENPANKAMSKLRPSRVGGRWSTGGVRLPSDREGALHLGSLELALGALPVAVDVGCHLQGGVAEVSGEPGDLPAAFQRALGERMPEAVEGPLLCVGPIR